MRMKPVPIVSMNLMKSIAALTPLLASATLAFAYIGSRGVEHTAHAFLNAVHGGSGLPIE
jgi:hypothetical protein